MPVQQRLIESLLTRLPATQITGASTVTPRIQHGSDEQGQ